MEIIIKKIRESANIPVKSHDTDGAYDLHTDIGGLLEMWLNPGQTYRFGTGFKTKIPEGYYCKIHDRSGLAVKAVTTTGGLIDSSYRGEWMVVLNNLSRTDKLKILAQDRIAQVTLEKIIPIEWTETAGELDETERGEGGFGSTGQ